VYTQRFNRRRARPGHVFQGRFKAILVEQDRYLLELARHLVLNPIRMKVGDLESYEWSSYKATAGLQPIPKWLNADLVLNRFGVAKSSAQRRYIAFVKAGIRLPTIWEHLRQQIFLGSDEFVEKMQLSIPRSHSLPEVPRVQRHPPARSLDAYANTNSTAAQAMIAAYHSGNYSLAAIGRYFGVHYSTVSRVVKLAEQKAEMRDMTSI
jgi:putative transposase